MMVEPPNLFRGRGEHPKKGTYKKRVVAEQIKLNLGYEAKVPICPMPGHEWGEVLHNSEVTWLEHLGSLRKSQGQRESARAFESSV